MTDIPEMYLAEAAKRCGFDSWRDLLNAASSTAIHCAEVLARTLQELGWKPPIDEARMAKARKVAMSFLRAAGAMHSASSIAGGNPTDWAGDCVQAAYDALGEA